MRFAPWLCLPIVCLATGCQASPAQARSGRTDAARRQVLRKEFVGYGTTVQDAQQDALEQAREWLDEKGAFDWTPPAEFLRHRGMVCFSEPSERELKMAGPMKVVKMDLTVTAGQAEEVHHIARELRMKDRQWLLARLLVGLVALLMVASGYLRLEEATRGYYTALLRVSALGILALVGAGLWLLA